MVRVTCLPNVIEIENWHPTLLALWFVLLMFVKVPTFSLNAFIDITILGFQQTLNCVYVCVCSFMCMHMFLLVLYVYVCVYVDSCGVVAVCVYVCVCVAVCLCVCMFTCFSMSGCLSLETSWFL